MDIEKLIEQLNARGLSNGSSLGYHCGLYDEAATAISTLKDENKRLNKIVCSIPTTPDSGRTVSQYDKEMSMCAYLDDLEAENEKLRVEAEGMRSNWYKSVEEIKKLRAEVESLKKGHCAGCSIPAVKAEQIRDLTDAPKLRAELEQVKAERDEAVQCIRGIAKSGRVWMCPYCVHAKDTTGGIAECELDVGVCMMPYSKFEWRGPHKED